jgi:hypothetical protein
MPEILSSEEQSSVPKVYDEQLYESFKQIGSFEAYEYLSGNSDYRKELKRQFISGEIQNPQLDYPDINLDALENTEDKLLAMKKQLLLNEQNEVVKQTYRWRLNEKIAETRMLKAVATNDMYRFRHYSEFIYGKPSLDIFAYTINSIRTNAEKAIASGNQNASQAATDLLQSLPKMDSPKITDIPDETTVNYAHEQTVNELGGLINVPSDVDEFDAVQIQEVFNSGLEQVGDPNWKVIVDEKTSQTGISVSQEKTQVTIPSKRKVKKEKLARLVVHEIGTHIARRINGERSKLMLLGLGLDRYERGDEGTANMREQALSGKVDDFRSLDGHLAIGLSLGLDGQPRDFRQVYDILEKYYLFNNLKSGKKEFNEAREKAQDTAWNRSVRTFRGTDCKTPGVCFTKDIVYREGNIGIWEVIKNNPSEMVRFNIGKYDPANSRHLWVLDQLGITDQDLIDLEK